MEYQCFVVCCQSAFSVDVEKLRYPTLDGKGCRERSLGRWTERQGVLTWAAVKNLTLKNIQAETVEAKAPVGNAWVENLRWQVTAGQVAVQSVMGQVFLDQVDADTWSSMTLFGSTSGDFSSGT